MKTDFFLCHKIQELKEYFWYVAAPFIQPTEL